MELILVPLNDLALEEQKQRVIVELKDTQKFFRGQRVRLIGDTGFSYSRHVAQQHDCIIEGSYFDLCNGHNKSQHNFNQYSIVVLSNPYNSIAWIGEDEIELISDDRLEGERLIREAHKQYWGVK